MRTLNWSPLYLRTSKPSNEHFRKRLCLCQTEIEKYELCAQKRDDLLAQEDNLQVLFAAYEQAMSASCTECNCLKENIRQKQGNHYRADVMNSIIPIICGDTDIPAQQNVLFTELDPLTTDDVIKPKPDLFDGTRSQDVCEMVKDGDDEQNLCSSIIPTKHPKVPVAANLCLEAKGRSGSQCDALRVFDWSNDVLYPVNSFSALGRAELE